LSATKHDGKTRDDLIGKQLGDYTLVRMMATGGMARIYEAEDRKLGRQAAIKVLEQDKLADNTLAKRFEREAKAVALLEHDNIITIYQFGEQDGIYFLAMKLVQGKDLAHELSRLRRAAQRMDVERGLRIVGQVAAALDYAHRKGIIHRDVKPSNILIDPNDRAILTDFGLVMQPSIETTLGTAFGTPRYIAPEQAISSNKAVGQSDIYSLAVITYEILTGETPFNGDSPMEIALSHISDPPPPPRTLNPNIPEAVEAELMRALEKEPDKRHSTATEFISAVKRGYGMVDSTETRATGQMSQVTLAPSRTEKLDALPSEWDDWKAPEPKRRGFPRLALVVLLLLLLSAGGAAVLMANRPNMQQEATEPVALPVNTDGAPISLIYDENAFVMVNGGDYELNVFALQFIRGEDGGGDDYAGDRVPGDSIPAASCFRIRTQNRPTPNVPQCGTNYREEGLANPTFYFWRREPVDSAEFQVLYQSQLVARCPSVGRGETSECSFNWPVGVGE
jgi:tRNA A-37 threonylcarbamoyl transferase component Bud32